MRSAAALELFNLGFSVGEIAKRFSLTPAAVYKRLHRAGIKCREAARACVVRGRSLSGASF